MRQTKTANKRIAACWMAMVLLAAMLSGCTNNSGAGRKDADGDIINSMSGGALDTQNEEQRTAMGRYVEKEVELSYSLSDFNGRLFQQKDGSLLLVDNSGFVLGSWDKGGTWIEESMPWFTQMAQEGNLISSMALGEDRTAAVIFCAPKEIAAEQVGNEEEQEETEKTDDIDYMGRDMQLLIIKPDGRKVPVEAELTEEDMTFHAVYISDTGRIIVSTAGSVLYEVKEDGSCRKFLDVAEGRPELVRFSGSLMFMDGVGYDVPLIYDMEAEKYIEDEVLTDFVRENFSKRDSFAGKNYDLFLLPVSDEVIYLAGQTGLYRHVLGGAAMEQVIDGDLCILGNPAYRIMDMIITDKDEFLILLTGQKLVRFVYDPDIPTVPSDTLKVYSLEDNATIRQAVSLFQADNPSIYVDYEIGQEQDSITREDAIKSLNTRIMAGDGPDVLILDDMPVESYIEKRMLMDIAPVLDSMGEMSIFPNVVKPFNNDGCVFFVPCEIQLPFILGRNLDLDSITYLSELSDAVENIRKDNPGDDLLRVSSPRAIMRLVSMTSVPVWKTESGTIDREAVADFLTQTKRIYDAQMDGLSEEAFREWEGWNRYYEAEYGEAFEDSDDLRMNEGEIYFKGGFCKFVVGSMGNMDEYSLQVSLAESEGMEECAYVPMPGPGGDVFWARTLCGISAASENTKLAEDFLRVVFGNEVQRNTLEGIPVSQKAIMDNYENQRRIYKDNDYISGSMSLSDAEGIVCQMSIRVPDEEQVNQLLTRIASVDTVYMEDSVLENVVYEEGAAYIQGDKSLEEAMDAIEMRLGIYLAE